MGTGKFDNKSKMKNEILFTRPLLLAAPEFPSLAKEGRELE